MKKLLLLTALTGMITACSTTEDKAKMETNAQAVTDSIVSSSPADSAGEVKELSPAAEEH